MYNGLKIKELLVERKLSNKQLLDYIGIVHNGSLASFLRGNPTAKNLEKIADFFQVSIDTFFDRNGSYTVTDNEHVTSEKMIAFSEHEKEISAMKLLLAEKERLIQVLMNQSNNNNHPGTPSGQEP